MDKKLAEYRARKRKEEFAPSILKTIQNSKILPLSSARLAGAVNGNISVTAKEEKLIKGEPRSDSSSTIHNQILHKDALINSDAEIVEDPQSAKYEFSWFIITTRTLYFLLWLTIYAIAINLEFGTVFLIISMIYFLWKNTRTTPKKEGEVSAYSVFNPNCEAIDGTLNAEQFEREIRYGPASMH